MCHLVPLAGIVCHLGGWPMVVGPCPLGNMTGSEVTETYGLFDTTVILAGRQANSKKSDFASQMCLSVCATAWLVVVNLLLGKTQDKAWKHWPTSMPN